MSNPSNSSDSGFYSPDKLPVIQEADAQEFNNRTKYVLSAQIRNGINNLVNMMGGVYQEQLVIAGEDVIWLQRKLFGPPCPNVNPNEEQCTISHCPICFETLYIGGYNNAGRIKMSFNPQKVQINFEQAGLQVVEEPTAWTMATDPIIAPLDIVVTYANERYLVESAEVEEKQGKRLYQRLVLTRLDKYDAAYSVPVPSVYGEAHTDFVAKIEIRGLSKDFPCTIFIQNFYWNPDGQNHTKLGLTVFQPNPTGGEFPPGYFDTGYFINNEDL